MRGDSFDELTCAGELHERNLDPAKAIFKLAAAAGGNSRP
jgi:hypothetical protein